MIDYKWIRQLMIEVQVPLKKINRLKLPKAEILLFAMLAFGISWLNIDPAICKAVALADKVFVMPINILGIVMLIEEGI